MPRSAGKKAGGHGPVLSIDEQIASGVPHTQLVFQGGRISDIARPFEKVVTDIRSAVGAISRIRLDPATNRWEHVSLASGFFISERLFFTCAHVLFSPRNPHVNGDGYRIITMAGREFRRIHEAPNAVVGTNLWSFPDWDAAIIQVDSTSSPQCHVGLNYNHIVAGQELAVAGFPLAQVGKDPSGAPTYEGCIYRIGRNYVTAAYKTAIAGPDMVKPISDVPIAEANFLFVPGNSGGPAFDPSTGRVIGYVHGFRWQEIQLAPGRITHAIYSIAIKIEPMKTEIEKLRNATSAS